MYVLLTPLTCIGITAPTYFELLSTPPTYIVFDPLLVVQYNVSHLRHLLLIVQYFKHFTLSTPPTSKCHSIYNVDSNSKYSN